MIFRCMPLFDLVRGVKLPEITSDTTPDMALEPLNPHQPLYPALWYLRESNALSVLPIAP